MMVRLLLALGIVWWFVSTTAWGPLVQRAIDASLR